jgi:L-malate glycosyltransferase
LSIVKSRYPGLRAILFGTPRRPESIPAWIHYCGNPSPSELIGWIYNGSSIFVCASWAEGFALPPAEAMACGCAVATTDCGGVREFAEHEVTALLSPPRDPEALARNILHLLEDDGLRQQLAHAGHRRIQSFTWERSTDQLEQFITQQVPLAVTR